MPGDEQVLVVERAVLEQAGTFQGLTFEVDRYLPKLFAPGVPRFMPRSKAETDPAYKQLIPYVLITCDAKYLTYVRGKRAGETRLVGQRSIGIGGHINPIDEHPLLNPSLFEAYLDAVQREVAEEVAVEGSHTDTIVALLNDDSTEVGRVHLGIVHNWTLFQANVTKRDNMITQLAFLSPPKLHELHKEMETWSQLCVGNLSEIARRCEPSRRGSGAVRP